MQTYDFLMLGVLGAATLFGFWKGMAWQIASLASLVVSYFAALRFSEQLAPMFGDHAPLNRFVAMLAIYIGSSFIVWSLFRAVSRAIDRVRLEAFDRQLGALLGFAKGVLLCVAVTFFAVTLLPPAQGDMIVGSKSGRYIVALLNKAHTVVPPELHQVIDPYLNRVEERLKAGAQPSGQNLGGLWPNQAQTQQPQQPAAANWPHFNWPQSQAPAQPAWPETPAPQSANWPTPPQQQSGQYSTSQAPQANPYAVPR